MAAPMLPRPSYAVCRYFYLSSKRNLFTHVKKPISYRFHLMEHAIARQIASSFINYRTENNKLDILESQDARESDTEHEAHFYYQGHIPTTFFQKSLLSVGSAIMCLADPSRDDMIAALGETTGYYALQRIKCLMEQDPEGKQILEEKPEINTYTVSIEYLGSLPEGTFGKEYWKFLKKNGFSPDARLPVHFVDDLELKYVMLRYRQTHDLYHTVLGMKPNMLGEVVVKWVEAFQTGLPMCALGAAFGPLRLGPNHRKKYLDIYLPWALECGRMSKFLMSVYWEKHWEKDLAELRKELNITPAP